MPTPRRGRACDACHAIKLKCELGSAGGREPPCQRCLRLEKICLVSPPVRQKDRIAELEAKLEEMTKLLRLQEIQAPLPDVSSKESPMVSASPDAGNAESRESRESGKSSKRKRFKTVSNASEVRNLNRISSNRGSSNLAIDHLVPRAIQIQILQKYRNEFEPAFPFPITKDYETLRGEFPLLLQSVVFAASPGLVSLAVHDELVAIVMNLLTPGEITKAKK